MGTVEQLLDGLRPGASFERCRGSFAAYHPGRAAAWKLDSGEEFAWCGPLHPEIQHRLTHEVQVAEIDLDSLERLERVIPQFSPIPRLTAISRDLSLIMSPDASYGEVLEAMESVPPPAPVRISAVDSYSGPPLASDEFSLTVRFTLQPADKNLKEQEIEAYRQALIELLDKRLGLKIRA
jgi:phenylalanyl-tRNA synthetase beta chain